MAKEMIWRKASRCGSSACVEVGSCGDRVVIRDSGDPQGPQLTFSRAAWARFRAALDSGVFGDSEVFGDRRD